MAEIDLFKIIQAKYIKLGSGGKWEQQSFADGTLRLGYHDAPHEFAKKNDFAGLRQHYQQKGTDAKTASSYARQILDFYGTGPETLWVTFADGMLWWCVATSPVEFLGGDEILFPQGSRLRQTSGWQCQDLEGNKLYKANLSGHLTKVEAYRSTICDVKGDAFEYLLRKIKGEVMPDVIEAQQLKTQLLEATLPLIQRLTWRDFELLIDLIFTQGGWRRINYTGGTEKTVDLELLQPMTGERAAVQIKSETNPAQLKDYAGRFQKLQAQKCFYVYHTSKETLKAPPGLALMGPEQIAEHVLNAGLFDWLIKKVG